MALGTEVPVVRFPEMSLFSQRLGPNLQEVPSATSGRVFCRGLQRFSEILRDFQRFSEILRSGPGKPNQSSKVSS